MVNDSFSSHNKKAVISIDIEEWYHLDYLRKYNCNKEQSTLDGLDIFLKLSKEYNFFPVLFIVGELLERIYPTLQNFGLQNIEVASHTMHHVRPLNQGMKEFKEDCKKSLKLFAEYNLNDIGFRAPCFSLDNDRLDTLIQLGFKYDSSKIENTGNPLHGNLDLKEFELIKKNHFKKNNFSEFALPVQKFFNRKLPIGGGGYIRILPWILYKYLLKKFIKNNNLFIFYIHPFELSNSKIELPKEISLINRLRFSYNRNKVQKRLIKTLRILQTNGFEFISFKSLVE